MYTQTAVFSMTKRQLDYYSPTWLFIENVDLRLLGHKCTVQQLLQCWFSLCRPVQPNHWRALRHTAGMCNTASHFSRSR